MITYLLGIGTVVSAGLSLFLANWSTRQKYGRFFTTWLFSFLGGIQFALCLIGGLYYATHN